MGLFHFLSLYMFRGDKQVSLIQNYSWTALKQGRPGV